MSSQISFLDWFLVKSCKMWLYKLNVSSLHTLPMKQKTSAELNSTSWENLALYYASTFSTSLIQTFSSRIFLSGASAVHMKLQVPSNCFDLIFPVLCCCKCLFNWLNFASFFEETNFVWLIQVVIYGSVIDVRYVK